MNEKEVKEPEIRGLIKTTIRHTRKFSNDLRLEILFYTIEGVENNKSFIEKFRKKRID